MTDEIRTDEIKETKCFCQSKGFRKFLIIALGTFTGVYSALCLFAALHRPPIPPCPMRYGYGVPAPIAAPCPWHHKKHFEKHFRGDNSDFQKAIKNKTDRAPFQAEREFDKD